MSFERLLSQAQSTAVNPEYNLFYDGSRQLDAIGVSIPPRVRALEVVVNWPRLAVDTLAEVLRVEGFESADAPRVSMEALRRLWQSCGMDVLSNLAQVESLIQGQAFVVVGRRLDGSIRTTVHTRSGFAVQRASDGEISECVVAFEEDTPEGTTVQKAAYYTPDRIEVFQQLGGAWGSIGVQPGIGVVPVIPLTNASRITDKAGRSEMDQVIPFGNAASRSFTLLQLATEILSMPQRYILGASADNFRAPDGSMRTAEEVYLGAMLFAPDPNAKVGQLQGASLSEIINVIKTCAEQVSAFTGIPPSMLGVTTSNPASAEAMRAAKERLIARGERKQQVFGEAWEQWARVALRLSGASTDGLESLSTVWADIALPSASARAASLLQAHAQGAVSARTARDGLPLTPEQRARENAGEDTRIEMGASERIVEPEVPRSGRESAGGEVDA